MASVTAVVLAGRRNEGRLKAVAPDQAWEALIPIAGRPMAAYVVAALRAVVETREIVVVGPSDLGSERVRCIPPGDNLTASFRAAMTALQGESATDLLVATGDAPLVTADAVSTLLRTSRKRELAFGYPIVSRPVCERAYPGVRRTYVRLRDGSFTGGNCFYLTRAAVPRTLELLDRLYRDRKHPLRLAGMLGWSTVSALVLGRATLAGLERMGSALLGAPAGAVPMDDAGIGVDVDKPEDLELCRVALSGGRTPVR